MNIRNSDDDKQHFFLNQRLGEKGFIEVKLGLRLELRLFQDILIH